ncbi:Mechanosensitive ion channel protein 10, partial [Mucuna pruriens]
MEEERGVTKNEIVVRISDTEEAMYVKKEQRRDSTSFPIDETSSLSPKEFRDSQAELTEIENLRNKGQISRRFMGRSEFSKPKSRMVEPPIPKDANFVGKKSQMTSPISSARNSPNTSVAVPSPRDAPEATIVTPRTPLLSTHAEQDDDEELCNTANIEVSKRSGKKWRVLCFVEWFAFVCNVGVQESIFHQYILRTLSGPPLMEMAEKLGNTSSSGRLSFKAMINENEGKKEQVIDVDKLKFIKSS